MERLLFPIAFASPRDKSKGRKRRGRDVSKATSFQRLPLSFARFFAIDLRALATFRVTLGALILFDLAVRSTDLIAMYTDAGMFPRSVICRHFTSFWNWSFHFASGAWHFQAFLFVLAAVLAILLLLGIETRLAVIGSWLMMISLHNRVPPILSGADNLLRMLLFWSMFLPLDRVWSLSQWLAMRRRDESMNEESLKSDTAIVLSIASAAILLQMAMMYLFSAIFKTNEVWLQGEALAGVVVHDFYAKPIGAYLLQLGGVLRFLTWAVLALEWSGPVLLFFPIGTSRARIIAVALLAAMHLGIAAFMTVGWFSMVSLAGLILFLPSPYWDRVTKRSPARSKQVVTPTLSAGNATGWVVYATVGLCLLYVIAVNVNGLPSEPLPWPPNGKWEPLSTGLGLGQKWNMFTAVPSKDGWYVVRADLRNGSEVDLLRDGAPVEWKRPRTPAAMYPNSRWRKIFREMAYTDELGYQVFRQPIAEYLCAAWNSNHSESEQVAQLDLIYCMQPPSTTESAALETIREPLLQWKVGE